jgi:hypothetical protein
VATGKSSRHGRRVSPAAVALIYTHLHAAALSTSKSRDPIADIAGDLA